MKFFALKSMTNNKGHVIGQQPEKLTIPEIIIELIQSDNISIKEFKIIKMTVGDIDYIALGDTFYQIKLKNNCLPKFSAKRFTATSGPEHILVGDELKQALRKTKTKSVM